MKPYPTVEALQKELDDMRAKAIAAVWLMREDVGMRELQELREEARGVFMGKDKQIIAKLQDEVANLQECLRTAKFPPKPGINTIFGRKDDIDYPLVVFRVHHYPNGGLDIGVYLP